MKLQPVGYSTTASRIEWTCEVVLIRLTVGYCLLTFLHLSQTYFLFVHHFKFYREVDTPLTQLH